LQAQGLIEWKNTVGNEKGNEPTVNRIENYYLFAVLPPLLELIVNENSRFV